MRERLSSILFTGKKRKMQKTLSGSPGVYQKRRTDRPKEARRMPDPLRIHSRAAGEIMVPRRSAVPQRMSHHAAEPENTPATSVQGDSMGPRPVKMAEKLRMVMGFVRVRKRVEK